MSRRIAYDAPVTKTLIEQDDSLAPVCVLQFEFPPMNCAIGHLEGDVEPKLFTHKLRHILPVARMIPVVEDPIRHTVFLQRLYNHIDFDCVPGLQLCGTRSEEHTSELQSLMRNSYAVFCLETNKNT